LAGKDVDQKNLIFWPFWSDSAFGRVSARPKQSGSGSPEWRRRFATRNQSKEVIEMTGRRAAVGLSLLSALVFCVVAASSASAAGTTAFTCVLTGGNLDFSDAHCDNKVANGTGKYGHVGVDEKLGTSVITTNEKTKEETASPTPIFLLGIVDSFGVTIECTKLSGSAVYTNITDGSKVMQNEGTKINIKISGCTTKKPEKNCVVKEPIEVNATSMTVENLGSKKDEMGIEFKPSGEHFAVLEFEKGAECKVSGDNAFLDGTAIATGKRGSASTVTSTGVTMIFTAAMTKDTLKLGGSAAELDSTITMRREAVGGVEQNPLTLTTTTP
jgi:hypothetical protein